MIASELKRCKQKRLGAFYTIPSVARYLVQWALRRGSDRVLDPAFGGGVFLQVATELLNMLGGTPDQIYGVEIDPVVFGMTARELSGLIPPANLVNADFFEVRSGANRVLSLGGASRHIPLVDAVVGNPPFIRYHRFRGRERETALKRASDCGVALSALCSSWAPFVVHATTFLRPDGRLAMVVPSELLHARYAQPVLRFLVESFASVRVVTSRRRLFPHLSQDTLLLLCDHYGHPSYSLELVDIPSKTGLDMAAYRSGTQVPPQEILSGQRRMIEYLLPPMVRELYIRLKQGEAVVRLGHIATVRVGYITGANDFFHLAQADIERWGIPQEFLRPCIRRGSHLQSLTLTRTDWTALYDAGQPVSLLDLSPLRDCPLPSQVAEYIQHGEHLGVNEAYKCRMRDPWFVVPHIHIGDGILTYMSGGPPRLIANEARVVVPNTLLTIHLTNAEPRQMQMIALSWQTSLTHLSAEIEGHSLGGGLLKLEPREAQNVCLALPVTRISASSLKRTLHEADALIRQGDWNAATALADEVILRGLVGLSDSEVTLLRRGAEALRFRRCAR